MVFRIILASIFLTLPTPGFSEENLKVKIYEAFTSNGPEREAAIDNRAGKSVYVAKQPAVTPDEITHLSHKISQGLDQLEIKLTPTGATALRKAGPLLAVFVDDKLFFVEELSEPFEQQEIKISRPLSAREIEAAAKVAPNSFKYESFDKSKCDSLRQVAQRQAYDARGCKTDDDCIALDLGPPLECGTVVNKQSAEPIRESVRLAQLDCIKSPSECRAEFKKIVCAAGRCTRQLR